MTCSLFVTFRFSCDAATLNTADLLGQGNFIDIHRQVLYEVGEGLVAEKLLERSDWSPQIGVTVSNPWLGILDSSYLDTAASSVVLTFTG